MTPITRREIYLSTAISGSDLPTGLEPITREEYFLAELIAKIASIAEPTQEQVNIAVSAYLDEHGVVFNTSEEITEVLEG